MNFNEWAVHQHNVVCNQMYEKDIQFSFHLRKVASVARRFREYAYLLDPDTSKERSFELIQMACYGHDLIEDARMTYNNVKAALIDYGNCQEYEADLVAEIIYGCTDHVRGKTRAERQPDWIYKEIMTIPGALFVKICDKIANVEHGIYMNSTMVPKYREELPHFLELTKNDDTYSLYAPLFDHYTKILK